MQAALTFEQLHGGLLAGRNVTVQTEEIVLACPFHATDADFDIIGRSICAAMLRFNIEVSQTQVVGDFLYLVLIELDVPVLDITQQSVI